MPVVVVFFFMGRCKYVRMVSVLPAEDGGQVTLSLENLLTRKLSHMLLRPQTSTKRILSVQEETIIYIFPLCCFCIGQFFHFLKIIIETTKTQ